MSPRSELFVELLGASQGAVSAGSLRDVSERQRWVAAQQPLFRGLSQIASGRVTNLASHHRGRQRGARMKPLRALVSFKGQLWIVGQKIQSRARSAVGVMTFAQVAWPGSGPVSRPCALCHGRSVSESTILRIENLEDLSGRSINKGLRRHSANQNHPATAKRLSAVADRSVAVLSAVNGWKRWAVERRRYHNSYRTSGQYSSLPDPSLNLMGKNPTRS